MASDKKVKAAAIQWDIRRGDVAANVKTVSDLLGEAGEDGIEVVVLPEMWASSLMGDKAPTVRADVGKAEETVRSLSGDLGMLIVGSNYEYAADGSLYNRATVYERGNLLGDYRKIHLFSPNGEDRCFAHGESALVVETMIGRVGVAICYDLRFPEFIRHLYLEGAEILLLPAQWPQPREGHWRILTQARAVENQWFVIAANRCGVEPSLYTELDLVYPGNSIIVDPTGAPLAEGNGEEGIFGASIKLKETAIVRRAIPVGKDRQDAVYARLAAARGLPRDGAGADLPA